MADDWHIGQDVVCVNAKALDKCANFGRNLLEEGRVYKVRGVRPLLGADGYIGLFIEGINPLEIRGQNIPYSAQRFRPVHKGTSIVIFEAFLKDPKKELIEL